MRCPTGSEEPQKDLTKLSEYAGRRWWFSAPLCWKHQVRQQSNSSL